MRGRGSPFPAVAVSQESIVVDQVVADVDIVELSEPEARGWFACRCRELLDVEPEDFLAAYDAGQAWNRWPHRDGVTELVLAVPFTRQIPVDR